MANRVPKSGAAENTKIFAIGVQKTGTTTLGECLRVLGYKTCPKDIAAQGAKAALAKDYGPCLRIAEQYEAFNDAPWNYPGVYLILDAALPGAKFILTTRDEETWVRSLQRWACHHGKPPGDAEGAKADYRAHNANVLAHFKGREADLLVLDWWAGDGWEKLCEFLHRPVPQLSLPHFLKYDPATSSYTSTPAAPLKKETE